MRAYLVAIALLIAILGGTAFFIVQRFSGMASGNYTPPPVTITAATSETRLWRARIEAVGTVRAARGILLTAETTGDIKEIHAASGATVSMGQPLLAIDDELEVATRERLDARLVLAQQLYNRDIRLIKENSIPQSQLDESSADLRAARAELAEIDASLSNKRIIAPFAGTLGIFQVRLGDYVEAGTPIVTLQDVSQLEVDFSVPDRYAPLMRPGLSIALRTAAFPGREFPARLDAVDARVDENTRNLLLRATILESDGLLPGMFASLTVDLDRDEERLFVPETAVSYSLQGDIVYIIETDEQGMFVTPRVVKTLAVSGSDIGIESGVDLGDLVVTSGQNKLYRGARVQIDHETTL